MGRRGFTLAELLVTLLLASLAMGSAVGLLSVYVRHFQRVDALGSAQMRGEAVAVILRNPILHAGLGLSDDVPSSAFPGLSSLAGWSRTLEARDGGRELRVVYGVPSGLALVASDSVTLRGAGATSGDTAVVTLSGPVPADQPETSSTRTKGWVLFAGGRLPLRVTAVGTNSLTLRNPHSADVTLAPFDELLWVRALRATRQNGTLYTEDLSLQPPQPRLEDASLSDLRFTVQDGICTVHVLARGQGEGAPGLPSGWPAAFGTVLSGEAAQAPHTYLRASWRVRN